MSASVAAVDRELCFDADGTATYGTLRVPAHLEGQRLAAALLLPGSGPTDRNGDVPGLNVKPRTLLLIAEVLAQQGIMSLRFDKYFTGRTGAGAYAADPGRIDLDAFIRQAVAAYHVLGAQPETRPEALLIAGHSEGGLYALLAAEPERVRPHPAGIALIEPMAEPLLSTIELQAAAELCAAVAAGRLDPAVATTNASGVRHAIGEFRAGRPVDTSGLLPGMVRRLRPGLLVAQNARYVRQGDAVHPMAAAAKVAPGRPATADRGAAHPGAAHLGEREGRAHRRRGQPGRGRGQGGGGHSRPDHRRHRGHEHPGQHDQPARHGADRCRDRGAGAQGAHRRQSPAAHAGHAGQRPHSRPLGGGAKAWAQPFATTG